MEKEYKPTADDYLRAAMILRHIKESSTLTAQERKTLRGQALSGDISGAWKGLEKLTRRAVVE